MKTQSFKNKLSIALLSKIMLFPMLILLLVLGSCRSDDKEQEVEVQSPLIGIWQPYKMITRATLSSGSYVQEDDYTICQQKTRIIFEDENKGSARTFSEEGHDCVEQDLFNFNYSYNTTTNTLVTHDKNGEEVSAKVVELTESNFVYELTSVGILEGEPNVPMTTTIYTRRTKD